MPYSDYQNLLAGVNFIGNAGQDDLSTVSDSSDVRTNVIASGGIYQFYYMMLDNLSDLDDLGYYDTANNDINNDSAYDDEYTNLPTGNNPSLTTNQIYLIQNILHTSLSDAYSVTFEDVAKVQFNVGTTETSHIIIGQVTSIPPTTGGYASYYLAPGGELKHGDVWLNADAPQFWDSTEKGSAGYWAIMHEVGHSLGLQHTNSYITIDSNQYSIMSYELMTGMNPSGDDNEVTPFGLQLLDIAALQEIYGRNYDTRDTATTYSQLTAFSSTRPYEAFIYTIWDGAGDDEIDVSAYDLAATIDLRQGHFSSVGKNAEGSEAQNNLAIAFGAVIENAVGTAQSGDRGLGRNLV